MRYRTTVAALALAVLFTLPAGASQFRASVGVALLESVFGFEDEPIPMVALALDLEFLSWLMLEGTARFSSVRKLGDDERNVGQKYTLGPMFGVGQAHEVGAKYVRRERNGRSSNEAAGLQLVYCNSPTRKGRGGRRTERYCGNWQGEDTSTYSQDVFGLSARIELDWGIIEPSAFYSTFHTGGESFDGWALQLFVGRGLSF